ncbi:MAG: hypothetical protein GX647_12595 [Clostridiales bacterium]|nr:hypothetical protein [Clostridiales bacterium]
MARLRSSTSLESQQPVKSSATGSSSRISLLRFLNNFYGLYSRNWHYVFAALTLTVLPVMLLYLFLQKHIVAGMTSGAVKG